MKKVSIIGAGKIGLGLATLALENGYEVTIGTREPDSSRFKGSPFQVVSISKALKNELIILSLPHSVITQTIYEYGIPEPGTIVIDTCNALVTDGLRIYTALDVPHGRWLQNLIPSVCVVRAFSHIQDELLVSRAHRNRGLYACGYAADDSEAGRVSARFIVDMGYVPVNVGTLDESYPLDPGGILFPNLFLPGDMQDLI